MLTEFLGYLRNQTSAAVTATYSGQALSIAANSTSPAGLVYSQVTLPLPTGVDFVKTGEANIDPSVYSLLNAGDTFTVRSVTGLNRLTTVEDLLDFIQQRFGNSQRGLNAYEVAVQQGFAGTVGDWLLTLKNQTPTTAAEVGAYTKAEVDALFGEIPIIF